MDRLRQKNGFICDMDGVIYHGNRILPGVREFVDWLQKENKHFLFLTNSNHSTPRELQQKLARMGLDVDESHFYAVGDHGLQNALFAAGITINDVDPDYVVIGESQSFSYDNIVNAVRLVNKGAKLIGTNSDLTGPTENGIVPGCRALISPIEMATGKKAYFVGKPNPLMMRTGLRLLGVHSEDAVMIGDRMDTDIVAGIESGLDTVLVLSGVTSREDIANYPYSPRLVLNGVGDIPAFAEAE